MIKISGILNKLENLVPNLTYRHLDYLIEVIKGFSLEEMICMKYIRLLDSRLISILEKCFPGEEFSINSFVSKYSILS